ncbi:hypothetical protein [Nostoc sp.]
MSHKPTLLLKNTGLAAFCRVHSSAVTFLLLLLARSVKALYADFLNN